MEQGEGYPSHLHAASASASPIASSTAWPDIGSSLQKFAAKLLPLPESISQTTVDVVCQIGRDGLLIFDSPSATQMLGMYSLQNIARYALRLQSDRAGDLLDAVTAEAMLLLGFTNWMYQIKYGSEEDDNMGNTVLSLRHGDCPHVRTDLGIKKVVPKAQKPMASEYKVMQQQGRIFATGCAPVIPPYNSATTDPKDVYPLGKIIRDGEWRYLRDIIERKERGEEIKCVLYGPYPTYVSDRIKYLWDTEDEAGRTKLGCILSFITYLIKFNKLHDISAMHYSSVGADDIPPVLFRRFSDLFIVPDTGLINSALLTSYVIVLCLFVGNFRTGTYLCPPIELGRNAFSDMRKIFELVGCKLSIREDKASFYAKLCTPLELPKWRVGGGLMGTRRRSQPDDSKNTEQVRKRIRDDGFWLF